MNRRLVELALVTAIPPDVWAEQGDRAILTAITMLDERNRKQRSEPADDGRQMSG